jgi:hypothetical protein
MVSSNVPEPAAPAQVALDAEELSTSELINRLQADRLWLLQQLDAGQWSDLRLDLAALERELGQLLDRAAERFQAH